MISRKELMGRGVDCPRCFVKARRERVQSGLGKVEIDVCPKCNGTWLDGGELRRLLGDRKLADYLTKEIGTKSESELVCPRCGGLMDLEVAGDVEVDACMECGGVWLDEGEMGELEERAAKGFSGGGEGKALERYEEMEAGKGSRFHRLLWHLGR